MTTALRRRAIAVVVGVAAIGAVVTGVDAIRALAQEVDGPSVSEARLADSRWRCLRDAIEALPDVPTYVEPFDEVPGLGAPASDSLAVLAYQRTIEFGFGSVTFVEDRAAARQVVRIVAVPVGPDTCYDLDLTVEAP